MLLCPTVRSPIGWLSRCARWRDISTSNEAQTLIRTALTGSGDIVPNCDILHIRLDPLSAPGAFQKIIRGYIRNGYG
jgi:hypothetical protein